MKLLLFDHSIVLVVWRTGQSLIILSFSGTGEDQVLFDLSGYDLYVDDGEGDSYPDLPADD